jgi:hypothetical protein
MKELPHAICVLIRRYSITPLIFFQILIYVPSVCSVPREGAGAEVGPVPIDGMSQDSTMGPRFAYHPAPAASKLV